MHLFNILHLTMHTLGSFLPYNLTSIFGYEITRESTQTSLALIRR